ncbi:MAG: glucosyl transferase [Bacteroidota bacterium]|nr:glucosyl transferase [Bacteroidota bacterium]
MAVDKLYSIVPRPPAVEAGHLLKLLKYGGSNLARRGGLLTTLLFLLLFSGTDCRKNKDNIIPPDNGPDTTSHNFSFVPYVFGGNGGSSYFKDVAIVSDSEIWAVGGIYTDSGFFNAARWDGQRWELKKIPFIGSCSAVTYPSLQAVWAFSSSNILVTNGGSIVSFDGTSAEMDCGMNSLLSGAINKIFAINLQNIYIVGNGGTIVHYSAGTWTKLSSGTSLDIQDIWGMMNPATGEEEILAAAGEPAVSFDRAILSIRGETVTKISDAPIAYDLFAVWFVPEKHYYVIGDGIYEKNMLSDSLWANSVQQITTYYTTSVRGNGTNDVFIAGAFGEFLHWNGESWKSLRVQTALSNGAFTSVAVKGNLVVAVGGNLSSGDLNSKAIITMGRR